MQFEFATATRIIFGAGTIRRIGPIAEELGHRAMVVTGRSVERAAPLLNSLATEGIGITIFTVEGEPTIGLVSRGTQKARETACTLVIGIGGGSALDAGKAIAALLTNGGDLLDYLEVIGAGDRLTQPAAPYIAIPTTAGTGAEVTRNAVLVSPKHGVKVSLRSRHMLPRVALVDPELTYSMPFHVTASTGLDALTQVLEPYLSNKSNPLTDPLCREGLRLAARSLRRACDYGDDPTAREEMALVSLFGGLALANAKLGVVHGLSGPLGGMFPAPHGAVCARLLPYAMEVNVHALRARAADSPALERYAEVAQILTGHRDATAEDGITWVHGLCDALKVPPLAEYGLTRDRLPILVQRASSASSTKGNPIALTSEELEQILQRAL